MLSTAVPAVKFVGDWLGLAEAILVDGRCRGRLTRAC